MIRSNIGIVVAGVAMLAWSAHSHADRGFTAEFESGATRPLSIALLPADASVTRAKVAQTEGLVDESVVYGELFNKQVESLLTAKGYKIQIVDPVRINADPRLQEYVVDANRAHEEMMGQYRPKRLEKRIYNAGDSVRLLADHLDVDAVAFSWLSMTIVPAGKAIVSSLIGGSTSGTSSRLTIVDGTTGDLEAVLFGIALVTPGDKSDQELHGYVVKLADNTVDRVPAADPNARIEVATGDEDVLSEVESLLQ